MAYRNFRNESLYTAPDNNSLPFLQQALSQAAAQQAAREKRAYDEMKLRRDEADKFKIADLKEGKYTYTQSQITDAAKQIIERAQQDILATGRVSPEVKQAQEHIKGLAEQSAINYNRSRELEQNVNAIATKKPWYRSDVAMQRIKDAEYGNGAVVDEATRAKNLDGLNVDLSKDPENLLNNQSAISHWMKTKEAISKQSNIERGDITTNTSIKSIFAYDPKTDSLNITADDVNQYFDFEPAAETLYTKRALELKRAQAERYVNEQRAKGEKLDVNTVYQRFIEKPETNPYDKSSVGAWKYKLASDDIRKQAGLEKSFQVSQDEPRESDIARRDIETQLQPQLVVSKTGNKGSRGDTLTNESTGYGIKGIKGTQVVNYQDITVSPKGVFFPDGRAANRQNSNAFNVRATQLTYGLVTRSGNPLMGTHAARLTDIKNIKSKDRLRDFVPNLIVEGTIIDKSSVENDAPDAELGTSTGKTSVFSSGTGTKARQQNNRVMFVPDYKTIEALNAGSKGKVDYYSLPKPKDMEDYEVALAEKAKELYGKDMQFQRIDAQNFDIAVKEQMKKFPKQSKESIIEAIYKAGEDKGIIYQVTDF